MSDGRDVLVVMDGTFVWKGRSSVGAMARAIVLILASKPRERIASVFFFACTKPLSWAGSPGHNDPFPQTRTPGFPLSCADL